MCVVVVDYRLVSGRAEVVEEFVIRRRVIGCVAGREVTESRPFEKRAGWTRGPLRSARQCRLGKIESLFTGRPRLLLIQHLESRLRTAAACEQWYCRHLAR